MILLDENNLVQTFTVELSTRDHNHLGVLSPIDLQVEVNFNEADEISFDIYKYADDELAQLNENEVKQKKYLWDELTDFKFVYVKELEEYFEIEVEINDEDELYKSVNGKGACESELGQNLLFGLEINTENDIKRTDYLQPTVFYNPDAPEASLLHRVLSGVPQYSIGHVDTTLMNIQRTFDADDEDIYSFLTETVAEEIGCIFIFDSVNRVVNAYDLKTTCLDCGYRSELQFDVCPECGGTSLHYPYGDDTTIIVDTENLAESVSFETDTKNVKNTFKMEAGDDNMTAAVRNRNPNGSNYIYYFSEEQKHEMPDELVEKLDSYDALMDQYDDEYSNLMERIYEEMDKYSYYEISMMPNEKIVDELPDIGDALEGTFYLIKQDGKEYIYDEYAINNGEWVKIDEVAKYEYSTATVELKKITDSIPHDKLPFFSVSQLGEYTSTATVNSYLMSYLKTLYASGYFTATVNLENWVYQGEDEDGTIWGLWVGTITMENNSNPEDKVVSQTLNFFVNDDYDTYVSQKVASELAKLKDEDGSVYDVLNIRIYNEDKTIDYDASLEKFQYAIQYYSLHRLQSFLSAIQNCIDIMIEENQAKESSDLYTTLYTPYYKKLYSVQSEIDKRQTTLDSINEMLQLRYKRQKEIQSALNFKEYLGEDLYKVFCMYKREETFKNDNYISDGLENKELLENAGSFLNAAKDELYKSGEYQHSIDADLQNLLAIKEFQPLRKSFVVGNFIRVRVDGKPYRLRLITIEFDFGDTNHIDVEFSDVTKIKNGVTDVYDVLNQASSMATSYGYLTNQVTNSKDTVNMFKDFVNYGMTTTAVKIVNDSDRQDITFDDSGISLKRRLDYADEYELYQMKIINNGLYITTDGWRTVECAIGKFYTSDPDTGKQVLKYGILTDALVGKLILGEELKIYSEDSSATLSFDNHGLVLNAKDNGSGKYDKIFSIQKDGVDQLYIDNKGNVILNQYVQTADVVRLIESETAKFDDLYVKNETVEKLFADYVKTENLEAEIIKTSTIEAIKGNITQLQSDYVQVNDKLVANNASIEDLKATKLDAGELTAYKATVENLLASYATIKQLEADYLKAKDIEADYAKITLLESTYATIENLNATKATIEDLIAKKASIEDLNAVNAQITNLNAEYAKINNLVAEKVDAEYVQAELVKSNKVITDQIDAINATIESLDVKYATIEQLNAAKANLEELIAKKATIDELNTAKAEIGVLDTNLANINTILSGSIGSGSIQTMHLTADNVVIDDAIIKSANISDLDVSKLNAGEISTNKFLIKSDNGGIVINGSTQQFKDKNNKVRLQVGQDAQGNFNFIVFGEDGTTAIYDENGITSKAVPDGLIVDGMVADDANIAGSKLNIDSVVEKINEDGSKNINSSKIWIDDENQSLGAKFTNIENSITSNSSDLTNFINQTTKDLDSLQGQIDGSIQTFFYEYEPTNNKVPSNEWTTTSLKNNHLGDLFYNTKTGYCYRWQVVNNEYSWQRITDVDVTKALADAANAQETADNKRRVFVITPTPPYDVGDLWTQGSTGEILKCKVAKTSQQTYAESDWEKASKYTDDSKATEVDSKVTTLQTNFEVEQGKITSLIKETENIKNTYATESELTTLTDKYNQTVSKVEGNTTTIANIQTSVDTLNTDYKAMDSKMTEIKQTADGVSTTVTQSKSKWDQASTNASNALTQVQKAQETATSAQSIATQNANKFEWIIKSGTDKTNFTLTDRTAQLVADNININGLVSFKGLDSGTQSLINSKMETSAVKEYIASRGENLIINGNASMGDNTNFNSFLYDGSDTYSGAGSFTISPTLGQYESRWIDEYIPVDTSLNYELSYYIKSDNYDALYYDCITCYDVDKKEINVSYIMWQPNSTTTLAKDLKDGDTVVYLTDVSGFNASLTQDYTKALIFWNYTNSKGYTYEPETYSRYYYVDLWEDASSIDTTNNTITLKSAWSNGTFSAGTSVSQGSSSNTFVYLNSNYRAEPINTWIQKKGIIGGIGINNENCKFRYGTAYIKVGWMIWHQSTATKYSISNISFTSNGDLKANQSIIDNWAKDSIVNGETVINGGYIKTNTINTDQLAVQSIFATGTAVMNIINAQEIDARRITTGRLIGERIDARGITVTSDDNVETVRIDSNGDLTMRGNFSSYNYVSGQSGWAINSNGTAEFNDVIARGSVITGDGGIISNSGSASDVTFWAGSDYSNRKDAPFIVYSDGSIKATKGEYSGLWTGDIEVGNIKISDPSKLAGDDALLTIQNGSNGIKRVQLSDTNISAFAQNISITDNSYSEKISLSQQGIGYFSNSINIDNASYLNNTSLLLNKNELTTNSKGFVFKNDVDVGLSGYNNNLTVHGRSIQDNATIYSTLLFGDNVLLTRLATGLNIDVLV